MAHIVFIPYPRTSHPYQLRTSRFNFGIYTYQQWRISTGKHKDIIFFYSLSLALWVDEKKMGRKLRGAQLFGIRPFIFT